jgi:hypothetical protein
MTATFCNEKIKTLEGLIVSKEPDLKNNPFTLSGVSPVGGVGGGGVGGGGGVSPGDGGGGIEAKRRFTINGVSEEETLSTKTD